MLLAATVALLLCACSKTVYVPVENTVYHTDTLYRSQLRIDSVLLRDSVTLIVRGDTVYLTKFRDRVRYRDRIDTVYKTVIDTVRLSVPYPVERKLTLSQRAKVNIGGWAIIAFIAMLAIVLYKRIRRTNK